MTPLLQKLVRPFISNFFVLAILSIALAAAAATTFLFYGTATPAKFWFALCVGVPTLTVMIAADESIN